MMEPSELIKKWQDPDPIYRPAPFWSWNGQLEPDRLIRQIDKMHKAGFGGFFMHSRYGLKTEYLSPEWFECISACIEKARSLGMKAYLYDEDRWPSGGAGGNITRDNPKLRLNYLTAVKKDSGEYDFVIKQVKPSPWENDGTYIDTMNKAAVAEFIKSTYDEYHKRYSAFFGNVTPAIFTDEPHYGFVWHKCDEAGHYVPWTPALPKEFRRRCGYDFLPHLKEIVLPADNFCKAKYDYFKTITELFAENFSKQIGDWCLQHNINLTGHYLYEQSLWSQTKAVGACMPHYQYMQWPGVDILTDQNNELATVKQCSSVAAQFGKERVLSELYGCTGWDWPLEGHKYMADWQIAAGVNFLCPHLTHYSLAGGAKRDYPASIIDHSPWWKYYKTVTDYQSRLCFILSQGKALRDVLVIHPIESAWGVFSQEEKNISIKQLQDELDSAIFALSENHYDWDFGDELLIAKYSRIDGDKFIVGQMNYKLVILPDMLTIRAGTLKMLMEFAANGGKIIFTGRIPKFVDGNTSNQIDELKNIALICESINLISTLESCLDRIVSITEDRKELDCIWYNLRRCDNYNILFIQSHDRKKSHRVNITVKNCKKPVVLWDSLSGKHFQIETDSAENNVCCFELQIKPSGSALFTFGMEVESEKYNCDNYILRDSYEIAGPFEFRLTELNSIPLDYCRYKFADQQWSELMPTLMADKQVRGKFNLKPRIGFDQQPWYLAKSGVLDKQSRGRMIIKYEFEAAKKPTQCKLVIENPGDFEINVNGSKVNEVCGWWIDEDFKTLNIKDVLVQGRNEVMLEFDYLADIDLEDLYIVGDFGTDRIDSQKPYAPGNIQITKIPEQLTEGNWVGQGLDFYSGSICYKLQVAKPLQNQRLKLKLGKIECTTCAILVNGQTFILPWAPFEADITDALKTGINNVEIDLIGDRKNILGPLHVPREKWVGPDQFSPDNPNWQHDYILNQNGLLEPVIIEIFENKRQ